MKKLCGMVSKNASSEARPNETFSQSVPTIFAVCRHLVKATTARLRADDVHGV